MKSVFKLKLVVAFFLLIGVFSIATFVIRSKMHKKTNELIMDISRSNTKGYTKFVEYYFKGYQRLIEDIDKEFLQRTDDFSPEIYEFFDKVMSVDTTISSIAIMDTSLNVKLQKGDGEVWERVETYFNLSENIKPWSSAIVDNKYLVFSYLPKWGNSVCVAVELQTLFYSFIVEDLYTSVYQVVLNSKQECVYHPDLGRIGKRYHLPNHIFSNKNYNREELFKMQHSYSNYLRIGVYKSYSTINIAQEEWLVISVSPGFEVSDLIAGQEKGFLLLFISFVITLLGILFYGAIQWKHEYERRMVIERENLSLQLKHSKQKNENIAVKLELLRSGLNSHFLFNSLGTLKALLGDKDIEVKKAFTDLSRLYRYQLRIEGEQVVSVKEEFEFAKTYISIINLRLGKAIELETHNLDDYLYYKILPISLQTLVDNCIKHNVASSEQPLKISIKVKDGMITVTNELKPKVSLIETNGKGLANLQSRYTLLINKKCFFYKKDNQFVAAIPLIEASK